MSIILFYLKSKPDQVEQNAKIIHLVGVASKWIVYSEDHSELATNLWSIRQISLQFQKTEPSFLYIYYPILITNWEQFKTCTWIQEDAPQLFLKLFTTCQTANVKYWNKKVLSDATKEISRKARFVHVIFSKNLGSGEKRWDWEALARSFQKNTQW